MASSGGTAREISSGITENWCDETGIQVCLADDILSFPNDLSLDGRRSTIERELNSVVALR
jgi:hypothetical protein